MEGHVLLVEKKSDIDVAPSSPNVYIILLNYNSWQDTNSCVDSLLKMDTNNFRIVICDNASTNDSLNKIHDKLIELSINNGIEYTYCENDTRMKCLRYLYGSDSIKTKITLINNNENKGFSSGNNIGIRFSLSDCECQYIWLLNNDTEVHPHALTALLKIFSENTELMMSSSVCCEFNQHEKIQCIGGHINPWTFKTKAIGQGTLYRDIDQVDLSSLSILAGPSVMIRSKFFRESHFYLDERYAFYFEEADLAKRILNYGYKMSPCLNSVVYHRGGHSTSIKGQKFTMYHFIRSKVLFTLKFYPIRIPIVIIYTLAQVLFTCLKGNFSVGFVMMKGFSDALRFNSLSQS